MSTDTREALAAEQWRSKLWELIDDYRKGGDWPLACRDRIKHHLTLLPALATQPAQPSAEVEPYGDLRNAKWLDPECYGAGACQSLKFKASQPSAQGEAVACQWCCGTGRFADHACRFCAGKRAGSVLASAPAAPAQAEQLEAMVDKAWLRFEAEDQRLKLKKSERVRALVNAGSFPGMSEAFDAHMGAECWTDPAYQPDASTWAAAWKAAKRDSAAQPVSGALTFDEWWFQEETVNALECAKTVQDECRIAWNAARGIKAAP